MYNSFCLGSAFQVLSQYFELLGSRYEIVLDKKSSISNVGHSSLV